MKAPRPIAAIGALVLLPWALFASACSGDSADPATATAPATATSTESPTPAASATPPAPLTLTAVAATISAIEGGDHAEVVARVRFSSIPCASAAYPRPPCPPGTDEGTPLPRLPFVGCEAAFLTEAEVPVLLRQVLAGRMPALSAIATVPDPRAGGLFPLAPFGAVFRTTPPAGLAEPTGVLVVMDADGRVVSLRTGCRATPQQLLALLPAAKPIPDPRLAP